MKQETLEEYTERIARCFDNDNWKSIQQLLIDIAKWQQEQDKNKYSEEEVYKLLEKALVWEDNDDIGNLVTAQKNIRYSNFNHWFEQFKKK